MYQRLCTNSSLISLCQRVDSPWYYLEATGGSHAEGFVHRIVGFTATGGVRMPPTFTFHIGDALRNGDYCDRFNYPNGWQEKPGVRELRSTLPVNVYAITAPNANLEKVGVPLLANEDLSILLSRK
jgi:hypothetical protein